jgi:hypothetical protein
LLSPQWTSTNFCCEESINQFHRLLLAPAIFGVVLPALAAPETAFANEISSLNGREAINDYMEQQEIDELKAWRSRNQVTSVNQFSDVRPTDWAYQALTNLVEKYGCVAGYWQPLESGIIPSISAGYGFTEISVGVAGAADSQSWKRRRRSPLS